MAALGKGIPTSASAARTYAALQRFRGVRTSPMLLPIRRGAAVSATQRRQPMLARSSAAVTAAAALNGSPAALGSLAGDWGLGVFMGPPALDGFLNNIGCGEFTDVLDALRRSIEKAKGTDAERSAAYERAVSYYNLKTGFFTQPFLAFGGQKCRVNVDEGTAALVALNKSIFDATGESVEVAIPVPKDTGEGEGLLASTLGIGRGTVIAAAAVAVVATAVYLFGPAIRSVAARAAR